MCSTTNRININTKTFCVTVVTITIEMNCISFFCTFVFIFIYPVIPCQYNDGYNDPYIGRVNIDENEYCDERNLRNVKGVTCCSPEKPTKTFPVLSLYLNGPTRYTRILDWTKKSDGNYIPKNKKLVYVLIHGYPYSPRNATWLRVAAGILNRKGIPAIAVDYSTAKYYDVYQTLSDLRTVGKVVAFAIKNWNLQEITKVVGFSFGGIVLGEVAKAAQQVFGYKLKECIGLDIANLGVDAGPGTLRLNRDSCRLVQIIHSSAAYAPDGLGTEPSGHVSTYWKSGHCDWWINCGYKQPNCYTATLNENLVRNGFNSVGLDGETLYIPNFCSHFQSPHIYIFALAQKCQFVGFPCQACGGSECQYSVSTAPVPLLKCNPSMNINYYVGTASYPYCQNEAINS